MKSVSKIVHSKESADLALFFGALANPSRIALLKNIAHKDACISDESVGVKGLSSFTVNVNLRYLKKYGLITGDLSSRKRSYCVNHKKIEELKQLFDAFYLQINDKSRSDNKACSR